MQISCIFRDEPVVGSAVQRKVKIHLNWVCQVRAARNVRAKMERCGGRDEGLKPKEKLFTPF